MNLAEYEMKYLQILKPDLQLLQHSDAMPNRIHTNLPYYLKSLWEEFSQAEHCGLLYQILFAG